MFNESSSVKGESRVDFLERQLREQEEKIRALQKKIEAECSQSGFKIRGAVERDLSGAERSGAERTAPTPLRSA